jgi:hypothetical protein
MKHSLLFSTEAAVWLTTGRTLSWLHLLPLASGFLSVLYLGMRAVIRGRKINSASLMRSWASMKSALPKWKPWPKRESEGATSKGRGWARLYILIFTVLIFGVAFAINRPAKYPVETHHNVYVWSQVKGSDHSWWMSSDDMGFVRWDCCPDFPCGTVIWPGYVMRTFKFEERGVCKSIRAQGLGTWWQRDGRQVKEW